MPRLPIPLLPLLLLPLLVTLGVATPTQEQSLDARATPLDSASPLQHPQPSQGSPPVLYARLGAAVNLSCNTSASRVMWRVPTASGASPAPGASPTPETTPAPTASMLGPPVRVLQAVSSAHAGNYECREVGTGSLLLALQLRVGEPPAKPELHCHSRRFPESFTCSWRVPPTGGLPDSVSITYLHPTMSTERPCPSVPLPTEDPPGDRNGPVAAGTVGACVVHDLVLFSTRPYHVWASASNAYGHSPTTTTWFLLQSIVMPDPPVGVTVSPVPDQPRSLVVSWQMPPTWPNVIGYPLQYTVRARHPRQHSWRVLMDGVEELQLVMDARPTSPLLVEVAARDWSVGNLSEWSGAAWSPWVVSTTPSLAEMLTASPSEERDFFTTTGPPHCTHLLCSNLVIVVVFLSFLLLIMAAVLICVCRRLKFLALRFSRKGGSATEEGDENPPCSTPLEGPTCAGALGYRTLKTPSEPEY